MRKISSLKRGEHVIFLVYNSIYARKIHETGTVVYVTPKTVAVSWLEGYKNRDDDIPYEDMVAVYNKNGEHMEFGSISGPSDLLQT